MYKHLKVMAQTVRIILLSLMHGILYFHFIMYMRQITELLSRCNLQLMGINSTQLNLTFEGEVSQDNVRNLHVSVLQNFSILGCTQSGLGLLVGGKKRLSDVHSTRQGVQQGSEIHYFNNASYGNFLYASITSGTQKWKYMVPLWHSATDYAQNPYTHENQRVYDLLNKMLQYNLSYLTLQCK